MFLVKNTLYEMNVLYKTVKLEFDFFGSNNIEIISLDKIPGFLSSSSV